MKKYLKIQAIIVTVLLFILFVFGLFLRRNGYVYNYEFWTPFKSIYVEFGLLLFFLYVTLLFVITTRQAKLRLSMLFFILFFFVGFATLQSVSVITKVETEDHTVYITSDWYLHGGTDYIYQKHTLFLSQFIDLQFTSDNDHITYEIIGNELVLTHSIDSSVQKYELD